MTKDEALKLALETLEYAGPSWIDARQPAITAIKEALAEQEQVEWGVDWGPDGNSVSIIKRLADGGIEVVGWEYAPHPPQRTWIGLTNEEVKKIVGSDRYTDLLKEVVQIVEAKLRSKNNG